MTAAITSGSIGSQGQTQAATNITTGGGGGGGGGGNAGANAGAGNTGNGNTGNGTTALNCQVKPGLAAVAAGATSCAS